MDLCNIHPADLVGFHLGRGECDLLRCFEYLPRLGQVQSMLLKVRDPLSLIPLVVHGMIVVALCSCAKTNPQTNSRPESLDRNSDAHGGEGDTRPPDPRRSRHLLRSKLLQRPRSASENGSRSTTSSVRIRVWTTNRPTRHTVETAVPVLRFPSTRRRRRAPQNLTPYIRCNPDKTLGTTSPDPRLEGGNRVT